MRLNRAQKHARTREELLDAAARVFARRGYDGASVAAVADEAGYSHGAVYSNFASKEDLLLALYERTVARRVAEIDAAHANRDGSDGHDERSTLAEVARGGVEGWLHELAADPDAFLLRLEFTVRAARDPGFRERLAARVGAVPQALARTLADEQDRLALAPQTVARGLQALSLGLALEALADPEAIDPAVGGELAARFVQGLTVNAAVTLR